ncbi:23 kDa jasmonate-induced protein-like [Malus domestica]|uniref:23 kDa jasmonate-induced protein-like n=1 Tax=Malus domestica TaxID=3750 RepID=UPI000498A258|nr:23 kDa jasmonate-induced protein-like [Malus domestica]
MADNVFGEPITNATLEGMREYACRRGQIERINRARVAMNMKNAAGKDVKARTHAEKLKAKSGAGIATLCLVYNATGSTLEYVGQKDWIGLMGKSPYPPLIANGQWAAFLHVRDPKIQWGSSAAVVYRGKNAGGINCDWMLSWANPKDRVTWDNRVYTEVRKINHFNNGATWGEVKNRLCATRSRFYHKDTWNGCVSMISTGSGIFPIVEGILTLENV